MLPSHRSSLHPSCAGSCPSSAGHTHSCHRAFAFILLSVCRVLLSQDFFFSFPVFTLLFRVTFSKRLPCVRPQAPLCHRCFSLAAFFIISYHYPESHHLYAWAIGVVRAEFISLASSVLQPSHCRVTFSTYTGVCWLCMWMSRLKVTTPQ